VNVLRLLETGRCWIKLVGYRVSTDGPPYLDVAPLTTALVDAAPKRCLWGTDWPHVYLEGQPMPDDGQLLDQLYDLLPAKAIRNILVDNPSQLYGFDALTQNKP
jgi:predicted TIM-barrel fold metal-dependent hydrolase